MDTFQYQLYGLYISSEINLPELRPASFSRADICIVKGHIPDHIPNAKGSGVLYEATKNDFLFKLDTVAKYRVQNGNNITVQSNNNSTDQEIRLFLLGSIMGALLHQRGILAFHGSAVTINGITTIFTGSSSVGKSSIAAGLFEKGGLILTDDIAVIDITDPDNILIHPGMPHIKLWKDVLSHLNYNNELERVRPQIEKYRKPIDIKSIPKPALLDNIIVITIKNTPGYTIEEFSGLNKFHILRNNTYRGSYVDKLNQTSVHFNNLTKIANRIRVFRIERPSYPVQVHKFADFIEEEIMKF